MRWKKRPSNLSPPPPLRSLLLILLIIILIMLLSYYTQINPTRRPDGQPDDDNNNYCNIMSGDDDEKLMYYAGHSGFSNQLSEFKNAVLISVILNRTLVVPPVLDHHGVVLGSCPKFRVSDPNLIRFASWNHSLHLLRTHRYVSMADIIDLSELVSTSVVRVIDFRVFVSKWCGVTIDSLCSQDLNIQASLSSTLSQCGSMLSGYKGTITNCLYAVDKDCRTTVWTYGNNGEDSELDSFQPDEQLKKKKKISYVRKRLDIYKTLGPGSRAESAPVLAFGSLFSAPYKGSESHVDIFKDPIDERIKSLIEKVIFIPFVPEIVSAGKEFASKTIKSPFLCAQLRLLDGQFKNHHKATFSVLKEKLDSLIEKGPLPVHIFVMTDLPEGNWKGTYLHDLANDSNRFKLHVLREKDELVKETAKKMEKAGHGMNTGFNPESINGMMLHCHFPSSPDILLYIEESICSCASLGFVGTAGSTIAESIELMRKNGKCSNDHHNTS